VKAQALLILFTISLGGCVYSGANSRLATPWANHPTIRNEFARDPLLAGVEVNQFTGNGVPGYDYSYSLAAYNEKHPAEVIYYFWDGRLVDINYSPGGRVIRTQTTPSIPTGSPQLDFIDFAYGSDPNFIRHTDPRRPVKKWKNLYQNDPELAAIEIDQKPREGNVYEDRSRYDHRHPAEVNYFFWDGRNRWISYEPYGDVLNDEWAQRMKPGDPYWDDVYVDFNYGSDPQFKKHKDPRRHDGQRAQASAN
jgi:hypothetical protein